MNISNGPEPVRFRPHCPCTLFSLSLLNHQEAHRGGGAALVFVCVSLLIRLYDDGAKGTLSFGYHWNTGRYLQIFKDVVLSQFSVTDSPFAQGTGPGGAREQRRREAQPLPSRSRLTSSSGEGSPCLTWPLVD